MSDQEKMSGASAAGGSSVVMVEQSGASRHKAFRPTDLQDEPLSDLHHKRSRAPAVPSVAEELKDSTNTAETKEKRESEHDLSSDKHKHIIAKKLSSSNKKRASSPETIIMAPVEVEVKRPGTITPPSQPIPATGSVISDLTEKTEKTDTDKKDDVDSITDEIAELRTAEPTQKASEWGSETIGLIHLPENEETEDTVPLQRKLANEIINNVEKELEKLNEKSIVRDSDNTVPLHRKLGSEAVNEIITSTQLLKKKEISWSNSSYLDKVQLRNLNTRSAAWMLERKASVGPCYRKTMPFGEPSGISICLPKKSLRNFNDNINPSKSGISLTVSRRCLDNNSKPPIDFELTNIRDRLDWPRKERKLEIKIEEEHCAHFLGNLKGKLGNLRGKIRHVFHM